MFSNLLIPEWRTAHQLWSVRVAIFWTLVKAIASIWFAFAGYIPLSWLVAGSIFIELSLLAARLTKQPGIDE
jgi:hypothetical protein